MHESDLFDQGPECMKIWKKQGEILKVAFGLDVFIDTLVWGSADLF